MAADSGIVIVTGAAGGLGRVMTLGLLAAGRRVAASDIEGSKERMADLVAAAKSGGNAERLFPVYGDVRSAESCEAMVRSTVEHFGAVDALINNAGLGMEGIAEKPMTAPLRFYEVPVDRWRAVIETNFLGPYLMARAVAPLLVARKWGRIINVVTSYHTMIRKGWSPYGPAKAGLEAATVVWSEDLAGTGVTVNALLPGGAADTTMVPRHEVADRSKLVPPAAMVGPAVWLTGHDSDAYTGYRFVGQHWDPTASNEQNVKTSAAPAAWRPSLSPT
jgi:3-oxoacyl-[acyl-carrier protein] reductase